MITIPKNMQFTTTMQTTISSVPSICKPVSKFKIQALTISYLTHLKRIGRMTTRNSIQEAARRVRQTIEAWEEQYGGAEEAVPREVVRTLIEPIDHICLYREEVDQPQQEENTPTATIESEILAVRLDRIEKALARLSTQTPAPTQGALTKSYATAVRQPKSPQAHLTQKRKPSATKPTSEPRKVIVRITDGQEKQRVNELSVKEIVQKVNKGRIDNQVIAARKLLSGEIVLYIKDKEAYTRLKANTT